VVRGGSSAVVTLAELVSSGAGVLAVCADASRRAALAAGAAGLARFNGGSGRVACARCGPPALAGLLAKADGGLALTDYATLLAVGGEGEELVARFEHVVLVDPPTSAEAATAVAVGESGYLHELWSEAEHEFALGALDESLASRTVVAAVFRSVFRSLRTACAATSGTTGGISGSALRTALSGSGARPLAAEASARAFRVLGELELARGAPNRGVGLVGVVSSGGTELERSPAFRAYRERHLEAQQFLARPRQQ
jgi:hypothetical protein